MSGLFSKPNIPKPLPVPTRDEAKEAQQVGDRLRQRKGLTAHMLTGPEGAGPPQTTVKRLLGQ